MDYLEVTERSIAGYLQLLGMEVRAASNHVMWDDLPLLLKDAELIHEHANYLLIWIERMAHEKRGGRKS